MIQERERLKKLTAVAKGIGVPSDYGLKRIVSKAATILGLQTPRTKKREAWWAFLVQIDLSKLPITWPTTTTDVAGFVEERQTSQRKHKADGVDVTTTAFLKTYAWRRLRMEALKVHGRRCQCCGATPEDGVRMNVDHIKPRRLYPELALEIRNLQVLCEDCNHGKGNWDETDWRLKEERLPEVFYRPMWGRVQ